MILVSPAMAVPSRVYGTFSSELTAAGFDVRVVGRRGFEPGDAPASASNDWSYHDEAADIADAVAQIDAESPERRPILLFGHSLGGQLAAVLLSDPTSKAADRIDGLVTVAASIPHIAHYPPGYLAGDIARDVLRRTDVEGYWPAPGFGAPGAKTLMREWATMVLSGALPGDHAARPIEIPTLAIRLHDDMFVSDSAAGAFEALVAPSYLSSWTYGPADCPPNGSLDHIRWVKSPAPVVAHITDWWCAPGPGCAETES
ncbi:hypothetical protein GOEFS_124_00340 [Gordonia effusa NBRC 100432]|uniref:Serine aminopeptidase S33 domain-containing protein n=2 Tax=Gordonia effusa TaxID=263908 RepID=H0R6K1_9ACTN|nr:hypothetical protein GOEFS_124_00340 [Gordonia effusa NBRC 100432]